MRPPASLLRHLMLGADAPAPLTAQLRAAIDQCPPSTLAARMRAVLCVDVRAQVADLPMPITAVVGTRDRLVPGPVAREPALLARHGHVVTLDAPHLVLQRRPREVATLLATLR